MERNRTRILETLNSFRQRKDMYISPVSAEEAERLLGGFDIGCFACGVGYHWCDGARKSGWEFRSTESIVEAMREKGLTDDQIIDELIAFREEAILLSSSLSDA